MTAAFRLNVDGPVAALTVDNPARRNAVTDAMWRSLPGILKRAQNDDAVRAMIVTGEGGHFCAGADISEFDTLYGTPERALETGETLGAALQALADFPKPVIADIDGVCFGGGYALALACDVRFARDTARFGITPAKLGLTYPAADLERLVAVAGLANAKDLILSARTVGAREALQLGLINRVYAGQTGALTGARAYAQDLARRSPYSQAAMKAVFADITHGRPAKDPAFDAKDFSEGLAAFKAKRPPKF